MKMQMSWKDVYLGYIGRKAVFPGKLIDFSDLVVEDMMNWSKTQMRCFKLHITDPDVLIDAFHFMYMKYGEKSLIVLKYIINEGEMQTIKPWYDVDVIAGALVIRTVMQYPIADDVIIRYKLRDSDWEEVFCPCTWINERFFPNTWKLRREKDAKRNS